MNISNIKGILTNEHLSYVLKNFAKEGVDHPCHLSREFVKFSGRQLLGITEKPKAGLMFENHSHSHFSDGAELIAIVDLLFDKKIAVCSLTDHNNSYAFDSLVEGKYDLNEKSKAGRKYELETNHDRRSMIIHSKEQQLILLRSIEYWTDKGEIGIHGYNGRLPQKNIPLDEAIDRALDMGGYVVINHPYFWEGIGFHGRKFIEDAVDKGAAAIEKNGTETLVQLYSPLRAELDAKHFNVPLITSGDAHKLHMYGLSGITFDEKAYETALKQNGMNHADAVKDLVSSGNFETYLNYLKLKEFLGFFSFGAVKEAE